MSYVLGVDLGTSYSAAAIGHDDGNVEIFQLGQRAASIPSLVLVRADGGVLVGEAAERRSLSEPTRTAREFKRRLGDPVPLVLGGTPYGADALMAILLRAIVERVSLELGSAPERVVVTHPASYGPYKLDLLAGCLRQAGLGNASLIAEPVAAAIHYASREQVPEGAIIAVYDFGGGTFDASVIRRVEGGFRLLGAPEGLERLGGIDFDEAILRHVANAVGAPLLALDPGDPLAMTAIAELRDDCRQAKEALSSDTDASIPVYVSDHRSDVRLTRSELESMIEPRIGETVAALERAVRSAGIGFPDVDRVLLVGGTSRIPLVGEVVHRRTGRPVAVDAHPKHAIALGAARSMLGVLRRAPQPRSAAPSTPVADVPSAPAARVAAPQPSVAAPPRAVASNPPAVPGHARGAARRPARRVGIAAGAAAVVVLAGAALLALAGGGAGGDEPSSSPVAALPTLPAAPTPLPTRPGGGAEVGASITGIERVGDRYQVSFAVTGFLPSVDGRHVHFFWSSVPEIEAGAPGHGPWMVYGEGSPFVGMGPSDRPTGARAICILVANADHTVVPGTGNCVDVP